MAHHYATRLRTTRPLPSLIGIFENRSGSLAMADFTIALIFIKAPYALRVLYGAEQPVPKRDGYKDVTKLAAVPDPRKAACLGGKRIRPQRGL